MVFYVLHILGSYVVSFNNPNDNLTMGIPDWSIKKALISTIFDETHNNKSTELIIKKKYFIITFFLFYFAILKRGEKCCC